MPFSYKESKDKLFIHYLGKQVKILSGKEAEKFLTKIADFDDFAKQLALAKITGNFKRGNEKQ